MNIERVTNKRSVYRRLTALAMALCLIFGLLPAAQAEPVQRFKAEIADAAGIGGQSVAISVYLEPGRLADYDDAFWAYSLNLTYDTNVLTLSAPVADEAAAQHFEADTSTAGTVGIEANTFGDLGFVFERQKVATLYFTVNKDAAPGGTAVSLTSASYTIEADPVDIESLTSGTVGVMNDAPTAENVAISGMPAVGRTLTGGYVYADREGNAEGATGYQWYMATDAAGTDKTAIEGATSNTLETTAALAGKYVFFEVTPIATGGATAGAAALSAAAGPVEAKRETAAVTIGQASGQPGATVEVPVTLTDASADVGSYGMKLAFDPAALEVTGIAGPGGELFDSGYDNEAGWLRTAWADLAGGDGALKVGDKLFTVTFKIKTDAAYGNYALKVADEADLRQFTVTDVEAYETAKTLTAGNVVVYAPSTGQPDKEIIYVDVKDAGAANGGAVAKAQIERTKKADGTKSDKVVLTADQAKQTVASIVAAGSKMANIVIPDTKDEVSEVNVIVPKEAGQLIRDAKIGLGIVTDNVKVQIPAASLQDFTEELYFRFVPIKSEAGKQEVKARAEQDAAVKAAAGELGVTVVGRPMTIETNLQNREVTLIMPLKGTSLSQAELANLGIYVEHGDGTKELLHGKLVTDESGAQGIEFKVSKFSTFTLVKTAGDVHEAYVQGYADGTFRPERTITRAEIAAILSRTVTLPAATADIDYSDMASGYWAKSAISSATKMGLMKGYANGTFGAEKPITRAELASLAAKLMAGAATGDAAAAAGAGFADTAGTWAEAAIKQVQSAGIIKGYADGSFRPNKPVTRAEAVAIVNKLLGRDSSSASAADTTWRDVPGTHWAYADILEASVTHRYTTDADGREQWGTNN
ncbi:S-layer homology domain-containing protein [Cohnella rhizosphaerae]|uniref:S-layer homology domain-containing protein n=1 Tax=Cohnella rhizosphaerae TaxID=1457232 RepID=A0A9X4KZD8_9BACL|nr:S-layer homology domain-containing protein [Cohnella rhizosphaerae]MDG0814050.1 S-layer homology domain-containing protein [Cohnella rhizosphaerae]